MKKKMDVIQAMSTHHYHAVSGEVERITITPEKSAIFEYLSRVGSARFVEFITDILIHVEGHTLVDKKDGPGDEKQDILTLDRKGERHLIQCKHTSKYDENSNGDELDQMVTACLRKECRSAVWVTNADLTIQGKRYVNDKEYLRGWPKGAEYTPVIDYWNGERIWKRVARNTQILNKWFGGMGQSHGLRSFFTDVVILEMPGGESCDMKLGDFASRMKGTPCPAAECGEESFSVRIGDALTLTISDWFASPFNLRLPFSDPRSASMPLNAPFRSLRVHAAVSGDIVFDPNELLGLIASNMAEALPRPSSDSWWYIAAAPAQAFVFLQDVGKPVLVPIGNPKLLVRVGGEAVKDEQEWALDPGQGFLAAGEGNDELVWNHEKTGAQLIVVDQALPAWRVADIFLRQDQIARRLAQMSFWSVDHADGVTASKIRNTCPAGWTMLQSSEGGLFWAHPEEEESDALEMAEALKRLGISPRRVPEEERDDVVRLMAASPSESGMYASGRGDLLTPIRLSQRIFWISDRVPFSGKVSKEQMGSLVQLKANYEAQHGYDLFRGNDTVTIAGEEVQRILADPLTVRGRRMLDVGFDNSHLLLNVRIIDDQLHSGATIAQECLREMAGMKDQVAKILDGREIGSAM